MILPHSPASIGDLLGTLAALPCDAATRAAVVAVLRDRSPEHPAFAKELIAAGLLEQEVMPVHRTARLGALTGGNVPLVKRLQNLVAADGDASLRGLAAVSPDRWVDLAFAHGAPPGAPHPGAYAAELVRKVEALHPTATLRARLGDGRLAVRRPGFAEVAGFLDENPAFDIVATTIADCRAWSDTERPLRRALLGLQRMRTFGATWTEAETLLAGGADSAEAIVRRGRDRFVARFARRLAPERLDQVYARAKAVHDRTLALAVELLPVFDPVGTRALPGQAGRIDPDLVSALPESLRSLFGDLDACACRHCQSVLGPAAYLVDLLQFVREYNSAFGALLSRRPDLQDVELSCDNSQAELPYLDLVLEILENAAALPFPIALPDGMSAYEAMTTTPLPPAVIHALRRTATIGDQDAVGLVAERGSGPSGTGADAWGIRGARWRWGLGLSSGGLWCRTANDQEFRGVVFDPEVIHGFVQALDAQESPGDPGFGAFLVPTDGRDANLPPASCAIAVVQHGHRWMVSCRRAVVVAFEWSGRFRNALLLQSSLDRSQVIVRAEYEDATLRWVEVNLQQQQIVNPLLDLLPTTVGLAIEPTEDGTGWLLSMTEDLDVNLEQETLTLHSLAYQSGAPGQEDAPFPEFRNPAAYEVLRGAEFPWTLPFDLPLEEVRAFLARAGVTRRALLEAAFPARRLGDPAIAAELLGTSMRAGDPPGEWEIIATRATGEPLWRRWGLDVRDGQATVLDTSSDEEVTGPPLELLGRVSILLQQARLQVGELEDVLDTWFVGAVWAPEPAGECRTSELHLALGEDQIDRLHRFVRLWRRLGWKVHEVDLALQASAGTGPLDGGALVRATHLVRLREATRLPIDALAACWTGPGLREYRAHTVAGAPVITPLYRALFQSRAAADPPDPDFAIVSGPEGPDTAGGLATPPRTIAEKREVVCAALGVSAADLALLGPTSDPITLASLTARFRSAVLARAARLPVADLLALVELTGIDPAAGPAAGLELLEAAAAVRDAGFTVDELAYVLGDVDLRPPATGGSPREIDRLVAQLRADLRPIRATPVELPGPLVDDLAATGVPPGAWPAVRARLLAALVAPPTAAAPAWDRAGLYTAAGAEALLALPVEERLAHLSAALLRRRLRAQAMATLARWHGLDEDTTADLVLRRLASIDPFLADPGDGPADPALGTAARRLHRCALLLQRLGLAGQLDWLAPSARLPAAFLALDLAELPDGPPPVDSAPLFRGWRALAAIAALRGRLPRGADLVEAYLVALSSSPVAAEALAAARSALAAALQVDPEDVIAAESVLPPGKRGIDAYRDPQGVGWWIDLLLLQRGVGMDSEQRVALTARSVDAGAAASARSLFRARYGADRWLELARPVADRLRGRQRDALVDHLIQRDRERDADALYARYLIDPRMSACLTTTRVLQASAAVQLFVQRCLMGLEPALKGEEGWHVERWSWMKSYRVWEANRKVFLYPENWLFPELRDDKTPLFRELESTLQRDDATDESAGAGLRGYLDGLRELSQIRVLGLYRDQGDLYLVGRSPSAPHRYFWRRGSAFGSAAMTWTAWERLDLGIEGIHVTPFVFDGDLHVAWPVIKRGPRSESDPTPVITVDLKWARRTSSGWTEAKGFPGAFVSMKAYADIPDERSTTFRVALGTDVTGREQVMLHCYSALPKVLALPETTVDPETDPEATTFTLSIRVRAFIAYSRREDPQITYYDFARGAQMSLRIDSRFSDARTEEIFGMPPDVYTPVGPPTDEQGHSGEFTCQYTVPANERAFFLAELAATTITVRMVTIDGWEQMADVKPQPMHHETTIVMQYALIGYRPSTAAQVEMRLRGTYLFQAGRDGQVIDAGGTDDLVLVAPIADADFAGNGYTSSGQTIQVAGTLEVRAAGPFALIAAGPIADPLHPDGAAPFWSYQDASCRYLLAHYDQFVLADWNVLIDHAPYADMFRESARTAPDLLFRPEQQQRTDGGALAASHRLPAPEVADMVGNGFADTVSFDRRTPFGPYDWELFFHIPIAAAVQLGKQQRFEDAMRWLHFVLDPTRGSDGSGAASSWRFLPFRALASGQTVGDLLRALADPEADAATNALARAQVGEWLAHPFQPHAVARLRTSAHAWKTVMLYLDNLLAWGDSRFRMDTRESIQEAALLYVMAADVLGPRPRTVPCRNATPATYRRLVWTSTDDFSNAWTVLSDSALVRRSDLDLLSGATGRDDGTAALTSVGTLYFCVPRNDQIDGYWDKVEDRLFKIRNCMNLDGVVRDLPLHDPPIDPALLVRAVAAGVDIAAVLADLAAPSPRYRFSVLSQKASELAAEARSLGASMLAALEKRDAERLSLVRAQHETSLLELARDVRAQQTAEAQENVAALARARELVGARYLEQLRQLGREGAVPAEGEPPPLQSLVPRLAPTADLVPGEAGLATSTREHVQLDALVVARGMHFSQGIASGVASLAFAAGAFFDIVPTGPIFKAAQSVGHAAAAAASVLGSIADLSSANAAISAILAGYERRRDEWTFQANQALRELAQLDTQLAAARLRVAIAERELANHDAQTERSRELEELLRGKFTSAELYDWMAERLAQVYRQSWQLAYDMAKRAERAFRRDLGRRDSSYIQTGTWDGLKKGLLAGELLHQDIKRMEAAYLDQNLREYEIVKHVSLASVSPDALLRLRRERTCELFLPELLFDLDFPGHYLRRIRSASVTIPCVTGPYTSASCTLTLLSSSIRHDPALLRERASSPEESYLRDDSRGPDARFTDQFAPIESIVTSSGHDDAGLFEPSLRDERYLPFEGAGAISRWRLELPDPFAQFDYNTITDVVLHLRYTARDAGALVKQAAAGLVGAIDRTILALGHEGLARLYSVRHDFPDAWRALAASSAPRLELDLSRMHFPLFVRQRDLHLVACAVFAEPRDGANRQLDFELDPPPDGGPVELPGHLAGALPGELTVADLRDLWLVVVYRLPVTR